MDKETLSNYGWIVICVLVLSVMIALATPFGTFISNAVQNTTEGLFKTEQSALEKGLKASGIELEDATFGDVPTVEDGNNVVLPAKGKTLEEYTWAEVQQIVQAGKATEYGFAVGGTKTLSINGATKTATIIGLNHDGENTATFMIVSSGGIGYHAMNTNNTNVGGWEASEMHVWLNEDIYNSMSNKDCVKEVTKMTNNIGSQGTIATSTSDKIFLLSTKEVGIADGVDDWDYYPEEYKPVLEAEGITYTWFESNTINDYFWLRSLDSYIGNDFFCYYWGTLGTYSPYNEFAVCPAFVIG